MSLITTDSPDTSVQGVAIAWQHPVCHITYNRDTWVQLFHPPSEYGAQEAKLLCQSSQTAWVAWVPNHGEIVLDRSHFYC